MPNYYSDNEDLAFHVRNTIDWQEMARVNAAPGTTEEQLETVAAEMRGTAEEVFSLFGEFVATEVTPRAGELDEEPPSLEAGEVRTSPAFTDIFEKLNAMDAYGIATPEELGGMGLPLVAALTVMEIMSRGDISVATHHAFHGGIIAVLMAYSILEGSTEFDANGKIVTTRFQADIAEILAGQAWGSMDITETNAGSDMSALRAKGIQDAAGNWHVEGEKIFITSGHGRHHIVIARTEEATGDGPLAGLAGLSLFLVRAFTDNPDGTRTRHVHVDRLEHKLGQTASPTCVLRFEKSPAELLGKRGDGFRQMLLLMNGARLSVSFAGIGIAECATRAAANYAEQRMSMGRPIARHGMIRSMLENMRTEIRAIRAITFEAAQAEEISQRIRLQLVAIGEQDPVESERLERIRKRAGDRARRLTPLTKFLGSERIVDIARQAIQIHGGAGFTREYPVEKLLRDAMVLPIYEGTTQIQALMVTKDTLGAIAQAPTTFLQRGAQLRWRSVAVRDPLERRVVALERRYHSTVMGLMARTAGIKLKSLKNIPWGQWAAAMGNWDPNEDYELPMLNAERLLGLTADVETCRVLLRQGRKHEAQREVLTKYLNLAEPRSTALRLAIQQSSTVEAATVPARAAS